jgi:phosphate transport system permease protein
MVSLLMIILGYVMYKGVSYINWTFLTSLPAPAGEEGGGVANNLVGSFMIVGVAALMAMPVGVGAAIFVNEFPSPWLGKSVRFMADVLTAVPSIVVGLVVFTLVVEPTRTFSGFAGAIAYAFIMIPIIVITAHEALRLVPTTLREASLALGVPRWLTIMRIVLPVSSKALLTGLILAAARALGETAPMLFTAFGNPFWNLDLTKPTGTMPLLIYRYAIGPYDDWHRQAWAAAFVLVVIILFASIITRFVIRSKFDE